MDTSMLALIVLGLALSIYAVHLVRVVREREDAAPDPATDPAADAEPLRAAIGISGWPPRSL